MISIYLMKHLLMSGCGHATYLPGFVRSTYTLKSVRFFSGSHIIFGKRKKTKKSRTEKIQSTAESTVEELDMQQFLLNASKEFEKSIECYSKEATQLKMGKSNPKIFDHLKVQLSNQKTANFQQIAQTVMKGNKFLNVTVFDPNDTKHVVSAILGANLNLNPVVDPKNPQLLKVLLPNSTKELKEKQLKRLKELTDNYKTSHNNRNSLASLRNKYMKQIKAAEGSQDAIKKLENSIEKVYRSNADQLSKRYKNFSNSVK
ncbi:hypothetical protein BRETT_003070 [Brettanomyces bruxellensis]|uniref:Ribosome-recycling factor, mitochondrial n=1 Tax=Dekkera bruxellensis TaxID=5007 RepID=A0A871R8S3_DEKBR|nr:uncharacterized protein BRETT_003070 [Brettanomyces bruxellensis]QOU22883.1 hypothetical protein BRETT_003070 [Brettanomyces bruxellensis]